jgi:hypothetical protein
MADSVDHACDAAKSVKSTSWNVSNMGDATERYKVVRADAMHGDPADDHHVRSGVGKAFSERCRRVEFITAEQSFLPELPNTLGGAPHVRHVGSNPASSQKIGNGLLESGRVKGAPAWNADAVKVAAKGMIFVVIAHHVPVRICKSAV